MFWYMLDRIAMVELVQSIGVAVGLRPHDELGADLGSRARAIVDDDLLAPDFGEARGERPAHEIDRSARRVGIDHAHGTSRKVRLRVRADGEGRHRARDAQYGFTHDP